MRIGHIALFVIIKLTGEGKCPLPIDGIKELLKASHSGVEKSQEGAYRVPLQVLGCFREPKAMQALLQQANVLMPVDELPRAEELWCLMMYTIAHRGPC